MTEGFRRVHHSQQNFLSGVQLKNVEFPKKIEIIFCSPACIQQLAKLKNLLNRSDLKKRELVMTLNIRGITFFIINLYGMPYANDPHASYSHTNTSTHL